MNLKSVIQNMAGLASHGLALNEKANRWLFLIFILWNSYFFSRVFITDYPKSEDMGYQFMIAKSLSEGKGYLDQSLPGNYTTFKMPSAYSIFFLIPYWLLFEPNIAAMRVMLCIFLGIGAWFAFLWAEKLIGKSNAYLLVLGFAAGNMYTIFGIGFRSEAMYVSLLYIMLFFTFYASSQNKNWHGRLSLGWLVFARTRTVGAFFFLAYQFGLLFKKKWLWTVLGFSLLILWLVLEKYFWSRGLQERGMDIGDSHSRILTTLYPIFSDPLKASANLLSTYFHNLQAVANSFLAKILYPYFYHLYPMDKFKRLLVLALFTGVLWGMYKFWTKGGVYRQTLIGLLLSFIPVLAWWRTQTLYRYLFPYFPMFVVFLLFPWREFSNQRLNKWGRYLSAFLLITLVLNQVLYAHQDPEKVFHYLKIEDRESFMALNKKIAQLPDKPVHLLSPFKYYTFFYTNVFTSRMYTHWDFLHARKYLNQKNVWFLFGPPHKDLFDEIAKRHDIKLVTSVLFEENQWRVLSIDSIVSIKNNPPDSGKVFNQHHDGIRK